MKNFLFLLGFFLFSSVQLPKMDVLLSVSGIEQLRGNLMIAIFDSSDSFPNDQKAIQHIVVPVTSKTQSITLKGLVKGKYYAIAMYHDENKNEKLDKNVLGIPTERYGFSNDARGIFGPPSFEDAKFNIATLKTISISVK